MANRVGHGISLNGSERKHVSEEFTCTAKYYLEHIFLRCSAAGEVGKDDKWRTMMGDGINLEVSADRLTRRKAMVGVAMTLGGLVVGATAARAESGEEISRTAESIHQEVSLKASRKRVYEALTDTKEFDKVIHLSDAMKSMAPGGTPTEISRQVGGAFALFGGHIIGRQVELVPDERIVQAWRVEGWAPGEYSIARFELKEEGSGTRIVFDHTGFPKGLAEHLASGWTEHYWEPLKKLLA
jgi:activator of HSP90 ATPase